MKTTIAILLVISGLVGCGSSYQAALSEYDTEFAVLERLKRERAETIEAHEADIRPLWSLVRETSEAQRERYSAALDKERDKLFAAIGAAVGAHKTEMDAIDVEILKQKNRVDEAKSRADSLRSQ